MTSTASLPAHQFSRDGHVVIDEIERTALVFEDESSAVVWCTTGRAAYLQSRPASDEEIEDALGACLGVE